MNPWFDGLSALTDRAAAALVFLFVILWGIFVMRGILFRIFGDSLDKTESFSLSIAGWAIPVLILSLITYAVSSLANAFIAGILALILILLSTFIQPLRTRMPRISRNRTEETKKKSMFFRAIRVQKGLKNKFFTKKPRPILIAISLFIPTLILRFAFIHDLPLPSYFDSAEHHRLIQSLLETYQARVSNDFNSGYYHLGFHHILASLAFFFQENIADLMLVSGPLLLTLLPFTFYFIVKRETDSSTAAFFTCLLAGFGFHMPAHLMNWGKYPALLGLFFIPLVLSLGSILYRADKRRKHILLLLAVAIAASTLIHSRTLIIFGLMLIAALLTFGWERLPKPHRIAAFILLISLLAAELFFIQQNPALKTLLESYLKNDLPVLILLPALILLSAYHFPRPTFFLLSWLTLGVLCLFIPITIPVHGTQTLLDRPFIQMFIFIPLSLLGGFGLSSLIHALARLTPHLKWIQRFIPILLCGFILLNAALTVDLRPSTCCRFVTRDDLAAFAWIDESTPPDAKILVASTGLYVTSFEPPQTQTGVDAGIWIPPLLSRPIQLSGADVRFDLAGAHERLCQNEVDFIYIGGMPESFDASQLESHPNWYLPAFTLPSAKIYQLTACGGND